MEKILCIVIICMCTLLECALWTENSRRFPDDYPIPEEVANYTTEPCEIDHVKGTCVSLPSCKEYMRMLEDPKMRLEGSEIVKKRVCGRVTFLTKVCCPGYKKKEEKNEDKADA